MSKKGEFTLIKNVFKLKNREELITIGVRARFHEKHSNEGLKAASNAFIAELYTKSNFNKKDMKLRRVDFQMRLLADNGCKSIFLGDIGKVILFL